MSFSGMISINHDLEKGPAPSSPQRSDILDSDHHKLPRYSRSRSQSRNFSKPSPRGSASYSIDSGQRRRTSSEETSDQTLSGEVRPSPSEENKARHVFAPYSRSPFAPQLEALDRHDPLGAQLSISPRSGSVRSRSMDVVEAVRQPSLQHQTYSINLPSLSTIREKQQLPASTFAQRVFKAGKPDLLYDLTETKHCKHGVLDLTTLERMNQHVLQQKLVEQVKVLGEKGAWMEIGIKETLHDYCEAVRDIRFMEECTLRSRGRGPFIVSTMTPLEAMLMEDAGLALGDPKRRSPEAPARLDYTERISRSTQGIRRLFMALLGGLTLLAPFLIMVLTSGYLVRVITTCVFTMFFASIIAIGSEMSSDRVLLVTAAYAAALVIFVGANIPSY